MTLPPPASENDRPPRALTRRAFLRWMVAGAAVAGGGPLLYASTIEPNSLEVTQHTIPLPGLGDSLVGLRAVQLSDLHAGMWLGADQFKRMAQRALAQNPDLLLITGDFMTAGGNYEQAASDLTAALNLLTDKVPVLAVRGNHDHGRRAPWLSSIFARTGVVEISNAVHAFQRGKDSLYIAGVDSASARRQDLPNVARSAPEHAPVILLAHEPDTADASAATGKFALQLSGHSHGGQVNLPLLGRVILPPMAHKYPAGLYRVGAMWHYTNRGIGTIHVPFRLNCLPEITVLTFTRAA